MSSSVAQLNHRILVVDSLPAFARDSFRNELGHDGIGPVIADLLIAHASAPLAVDVLHGVSDNPDPAAFSGYDGIVWGGSPLSVNDGSSDVDQLTEWMRLTCATGLPVFAICFGLQLATVVGGGKVSRNPRGRETVVARKINISSAGESHPMMERRFGTFDAISEHVDVVRKLPPGAVVLASNAMTDVQAAVFTVDQSEVWGVQYHPEMDLSFFGPILKAQRSELISEGLFNSKADHAEYLNHIRRIAAEPDAKDVAWQLGFDDDVLDVSVRMSELCSWIDQQVLTRKKAA